MSDGERDASGRFLPGNTTSALGGRPVGRLNEETYRGRALRALGDQLTPDKFREFTTGWLDAAFRRPDSWQAKQFADLYLSQRTLDEIDAFRGRALREDHEFLHYRIYRAQSDVQRRISASRERQIVLRAGRRAGKTAAISQWIAGGLIDGERCLYVGQTVTTAARQMWDLVRAWIRELGIEVERESVSERTIALRSGAFFALGGASNAPEREKYRGEKWHRIAVDECQSQPRLRDFIDSVLAPMLLDYSGTLLLAGTGPRIRGTDWEQLSTSPDVVHWSIEQNPFIEGHQTILADIRERRGLSENSNLYRREYLGEIAYDDDALVLRLDEANIYTQDDLSAWVASQPPSDLRFTGGLDYGWTDADAVAIILYSISRPERWLLAEYKGNRNDLTELKDHIVDCMQRARDNLALHEMTDRSLYIYADTNEKHVTAELYNRYQIPITDAYKSSRDLGLEMLQEDVRTGNFRVLAQGPFADECRKTVFRRDEQDNLTRELDDDTYHPDMIMAVMYAMRYVWMQGGRG